MTKQDTSENPAKIVYLGLGSNLGNRKANIEKAIIELLKNKIIILKLSSYYESLSWPNPKNPKFLNIVIKVNTKLKPKILLSICKKIEILIGRRVSLKNSPRECDIDIIDYDNLQSKNGIILPHPRMHKRNFVLFPLFEINKNWKHPLSRNNIKKLIYSLSNNDITSIKKI